MNHKPQKGLVANSAETAEIREDGSEGTAYISTDGMYRYSLVRKIRVNGGGTVTFIMLNPSTADASQDDPTIRRCVGFARLWGFTTLKVVNLYAFRATKPSDLFAAIDPVGPKNDHEISLALGGSDLTIAAWGAHARPDRLAQFADTFHGLAVHALGLTKDGAPRHPLYLRADSKPFIYEIGERRAA